MHICTRVILGFMARYQGVLFTLMDDVKAWKMTLARDIKQAYIDVDMNKAI